jgi:hypothetical protein
MPDGPTATPTPSQPAGDATSKNRKIDWSKVRRERDASIEAGTACLKGVSSDRMLPYWAIVSKEYRALPKTKAENAVMICVISHAGEEFPSAETLAANPEAGWCTCSVRTLSEETHTHPDYTRWTLKHLVSRGLLVERRDPGKPTWYKMVNKTAWLHDKAATDQGVPQKYGETQAEAKIMILWERTTDLMPYYPAALFESRTDTPLKRKLYADCLDTLEDRIDRGANPRMAAEALPPVEDKRAVFEDIYKRALEAQGPAPP